MRADEGIRCGRPSLTLRLRPDKRHVEASNLSQFESHREFTSYLGRTLNKCLMGSATCQLCIIMT